MSYALLWIENVAAALLFVALIVACASRLTKRRMAVVIPAVLAVLLFYGTPTVLAGYLKFPLGIRYSPFYYGLSLLIVCMVGTGYVARRGLRRGTDTDAPNGRAWPRLKLVVAFAIAAALCLMTFWNMDLAVQTRMSALRAEAGALVLSVAPARAPDRDNAALVYEQAFALMLSPDDAPEAWSTIGKWWSREQSPNQDMQDAESQAFLQQQADALALVRRATAMPACYFELESERFSLTLLMPQLGKMRDAARLLAASARDQAAHGRIAPALGDVAGVYQMSKHLESEPTLISALTAIAVDALGARALEAVLASNQPTPEDLTAIRFDVPSSAQRTLRRAFCGEEAIGLSVFSDLGRDQAPGFVAIFGTSTPVPRTSLAPYRVFLMSQDVAGYRNFMAEQRRLAGEPYYQVQPAVQDLERSFRTNPPGPLTRIIAPALSAAMKTAVDGDARHRLATLGLAMARYQAEHKEYPDRLEDLVPDHIDAVPIDPFDGKPMKMRVAEGRIVLYSVGRNMIDDQGVESANDKQSGDLTFSLRRWSRSE